MSRGLRAARKGAANLDAFDCCMRGMWHYQQFTLDDNRQAESLDEEFVVGPQTTVSFIKLTPLVGG